MTIDSHITFPLPRTASYLASALTGLALSLFLSAPGGAQEASGSRLAGGERVDIQGEVSRRPRS